jgi:glyoxylase-like metal-dependent hydrolase (beta-lactamase superfamily II)
MSVPEFSVSNWADDGTRVAAGGAGVLEDLGLVIYQTPGHMPDQVAIWDPEERFLYVGDTVYQHAPILFPEGASFLKYRDTVRRLRTLVHNWNTAAGPATGNYHTNMAPFLISANRLQAE